MDDAYSLLSPRAGMLRADASFLRRVGAFLIDVLLIDLLIAAPFAPLLSGLVSRAKDAPFGAVAYTSIELGVILAILLLAFAYFVLFEYLLGQTIGMMFLRTRVEPTALWRHMVRNCFLIPAFPFLLFWLIEPIAIGLWRRGVLEHLTGTRTIHERSIII